MTTRTMMMTRRLGALLLPALLLGACASTRNDEALVQARAQVQAASENPQVARHATHELARAQEALRGAEAAAREERGRDEVAHRAYVATQLAQAATAQADARQAQEQLQQASSERDRIRLQARSREAEMAQQQAQQAQQQAQAAQQQQEQLRQQLAEQQMRQQQAQAQRELEEAQQRAQQASQRAEQLQQQLKEFEAKQTQRGTVMTLGGDVLFDSGKSTLRAGARRTIDRLAEVLQQHPERRVSIEGFTDAQGSDDFNMNLSRQRAESVKQALVQEGVPAERVETRAYGESYPVADNDTPAGRQMNRRVEIVISNEQGQIGSRQQ